MSPKEGRSAPVLLLASADVGRRAMLRGVLCRAGFEVAEAAGEGASLETFGRLRPDAVLIDAGLPEGALELCRRLRSEERCGSPSTPILLLVQPEHLGALDEARAAGASDFVEISLHGALIEPRVRRALEACAREQRPSDSSARPSAARDAGERSSVLEELSRSIERAGVVEKRLAVLAVEVDPRAAGAAPDLAARAPESAAHELLGVLTEAVREFEADAARDRSRSAIQVRVLEGSRPRAVVLVPELGAEEEAARLGGRIREALAGSALCAVEGNGARIGVGISTFPSDASGAEELLLLADRAAELARIEGLPAARFHAPATQRRSLERLELEQRLRLALERGELSVHYQPKMAVRTRQIVGMEALVRWEHPELGAIQPAEFIPLAEETGLIVPLGEQVLRAACQQGKLWQDRGMQPVRMAVNLSQVQFRRPDLCASVARILAETGLAPEWLELELTESMLMQDVQATIHGLERLKSAGIQLSIDDFGTGYSSLSYLRRFPIDALKIDRSFVREVISDPDDAAIVTSIILMAHSLKLGVIAEGVETEGQLAFLEVLQCDEIQGYLISPPVPAAQAEAFLIGGRR